MCRVIFKDMPCRIKAFTCEDADGFQTVIINSRLSYLQNVLSAIHENTHINDFGRDYDVNELELNRHFVFKRSV